MKRLPVGVRRFLQKDPVRRRILTWVGWVALVVGAYIAASLLSSGLVLLLRWLGVAWSLETTTGILIYRTVFNLIMIGVIAAGAYFGRQALERSDFGVNRELQWRDIGLGILGLVVYFLLAMVALWLASHIPGFDATETQDVGLGSMYAVDRVVAFMSIVVITPILEEIMFRGMLYGGLRRSKMPWWGAAVIVSALFGLAHMQWNVAIDVFVLSMVACYLRELTGGIWAGFMLHMLKNGLAFFVLLSSVNGV